MSPSGSLSDSISDNCSGNELNRWLSKLEGLHPNKIDLGLERIRSVASTLGLLKPRAKIITIAGTNGKGSTVAALQALLLSSVLSSVLSNEGDDADPDEADGGQEGNVEPKSSKRVGCFTSPHLLRFNERIAVNGEHASDRMICKAFEAIEEARQSITLTYFEFSALAALWVFQQEKVDYMILEVGLGGRLDAVNILDADIAIITSIALDHQAWLGDSIDLISVEKGGILRDRQEIIFGQQQMPSPLVELAKQKVANGASLVLYQQLKLQSERQLDIVDSPVPNHLHGWAKTSKGLKWCGSNNVASDKDCKDRQICVDISFLKNLTDVPLSLSAWSCALQAASYMGVLPDAKQLEILLRETRLLGRRSQHVFEDRVFVCDVAHNPAAVQNLVDYFQASDSQLLPVIFAALDDKALEEMVCILEPITASIAVPALQGSVRVLAPDKIVDRLSAALRVCSRKNANADTIDEELLIKPFATMEAAINWAIQATDSGDKILVLGSFLTVAECIEYIGNV